jgi:hypothetical protein
MIVKIDRDILKGCYEILKKYFIVQEFTSVHKITTKEKKLYNEVAKLLEEKK